MNTCGLTRHRLSILLIAFTVLLLVSACQLLNVSNDIPTEQPNATMLPAELPTATQASAQATEPLSVESANITLDLADVAQNQTVETVAEVTASAGGPFWEVAPQHLRVTLLGYPESGNALKPQIFVYPVNGLAGSNEAAGQTVIDLQSLLQTRQSVDRMPFLPMFNSSQVMHTQVQFLDFKNGSGVRFLTEFDQAIMPINNLELIYSFQGLTRDGKYYIAAVLPVTHPELPSSQQVSTEQIAELNEFPAYLAKTVSWLDQQSGSSFTPDLAKLDALIQSITVK